VNSSHQASLAWPEPSERRRFDRRSFGEDAFCFMALTAPTPQATRPVPKGDALR